MAELSPTLGQELLSLTPATIQPAGRILIRQGERTDRRVFLLSPTGTRPGALAKVTTDLPNGEQCLLGIRVSGELVGELASLRNLPRSATVTLCSDAEVRAIPEAQFIAFLRRHPEAGLAVAGMVAARLDWANRRREDMTGYDVPTRIGHVLADLFDRHGRSVRTGYDLGVQLTQVELGRLVGAKQAAVGKAMRGLRERGIAMTRYRRVIVLRPDRLRPPD
ncbi:Crp/Fnr family transcriptional regulator [Nonomuraea fuscirosea]|uniref:Crp/Fnr family transcriptional regulator n=1 Tax=Nonomuraea fuscirosea TaxID=1291556 RepID=UPI003443EBB7